MIATIYAACLFAGAVLPSGLGVLVTTAGLVVNVALPLAFMKRLNRIPLNFPHLVERLNLLVIITFGEMVVQIAPWFTPETLSPVSALVFGICASLFVHYVWVFDRMIDLDVGDQGAYRMQFAHIPVFLGLGIVTVSLNFLMEPEASMHFVVPFMFVGILFFYLGLIGSNSYRQRRFRVPRRQLTWQVAGFAVTLALFLALANVRWAVVLVAFLLTVGECAAMGLLYQQQKAEAV